MTPYGPKKRIFVSIGQRQGASTADQGRGESATRPFAPNDSIRKNRLSEGSICGIVSAWRGRADFHQALMPRDHPCVGEMPSFGADHPVGHPLVIALGVIMD